MNIQKIQITLFSLTACAFFACARTRPPEKAVEPVPASFRWELVLCQYSGTYDTRRFTENQLKNTVQLLQPGAFDLPVSGTVWKHSEIANLDIGALDRQYEELKSRLEQLDIVPVEDWNQVRQRLLDELGRVYRLTRITWQAYLRPVVLRDYPGAEECKTLYAEPLIEGGEKLLEAWRRVNENSRKNNVDPDRLRRIFEEQDASPDRMKFALVETMAFGWWNCANALLDRKGLPPELEQECKKLFIRIDSESCDEP